MKAGQRSRWILRLRATEEGKRALRTEQRRAAVPPGSKLQVSCGGARRPGFVTADPRPHADADVWCFPWELSSFCEDLAEIYAPDILDRMFYADLRPTLNSWFDALSVGARLVVEVPDFDLHVAAWASARRDMPNDQDPEADARRALAGIFGSELERTPHLSQFGAAWWQIKKCGFDADLLATLLGSSGYAEVGVTRRKDGMLVATARKTVSRHERQVAARLDWIRPDHVRRYTLASSLVGGRDKVLDVACGVGYGAWLLADRSEIESVRGSDIDTDAVAFAQAHYSSPRVSYVVEDALDADWPDSHYDVVVSFETIEHLRQADHFLQAVNRTLKESGTLICSVPNEEAMPFKAEAFPFHVRHYRGTEFEAMLNRAGFEVTDRYTQWDQHAGEVVPGWGGAFNIAVCRKSREAASPPRYSVVVPAYNAQTTIGQCIEALLEQDLPTEQYEVIVVDNASTDRTPEIIRSYERVKYQREATQGPAAARNRGVAIAQGDVIAFTDADCVPLPQWLRSIVAPIDQGNLDVCGGEVEPTSTDTEIERFGEVWFWPIERILSGELFHKPYVITANAAYRRAVIDQVGAFDPRFPVAGYEDTELGWRSHDAGARFGYVPEAVVKHRHRTTLKGLFFMGYKGALGREILLDRHQDDVPPARGIGWHLLRFLRFAARGLLIKDKRYKRRVWYVYDLAFRSGQLYGTLQGKRHLGKGGAEIWRGNGR